MNGYLRIHTQQCVGLNHEWQRRERVVNPGRVPFWRRLFGWAL